MSVTTVEAYLALLRKMQLIRAVDVDRALGEFRQQTRENIASRTNLDVFSEFLVRRGYVSSYQDDLLRTGRTRGYFIGKYKLVSQTSLGGIGLAYYAEHTLTRRQVILKLLPPLVADDAAGLQKLLSDARKIVGLQHPNVVQLYGIEEADELYFLVYEFVEGVTLEAQVEEEGPLPLQAALLYLHQLASGLAQAHAKGIVHKQIQPGNVLLNTDGMVKLLDLGLSNYLTEFDGTEEINLHYAEYQAPEVALGGKVDGRADLYSIGCLAYFILSGHPPFEADTTLELRLLHADSEPPPLAERCADMTAEVSEVFMRLLAKEPADRYASASEFVAASEPFIGEATDEDYTVPAPDFDADPDAPVDDGDEASADADGADEYDRDAGFDTERQDDSDDEDDTDEDLAAAAAAAQAGVRTARAQGRTAAESAATRLVSRAAAPAVEPQSEVAAESTARPRWWMAVGAGLGVVLALVGLALFMFPDRAATSTADVASTAESTEDRGSFVDQGVVWQGTKASYTVGIGPSLRIFDDEPQFTFSFASKQLPALHLDDKYSGASSVKIYLPQAANPALEGLVAKIREKPAPGEFRYLVFAWKKKGGKAIGMQLAKDGKFSPFIKGQKSYAYVAGDAGSRMAGALSVNSAPPANWMFNVRDLYADFGSFDMTGLSFLPLDGEYGIWDHIYLVRERRYVPLASMSEAAIETLELYNALDVPLAVSCGVSKAIQKHPGYNCERLNGGDKNEWRQTWSHRWTEWSELKVRIRTLPNIRGKLYLVLACDNNQRRERITLNGRLIGEFDQFKTAKTVEIQISESDTKTGEMLLNLKKTGQHDATLSMVFFIPEPQFVHAKYYPLSLKDAASTPSDRPMFLNQEGEQVTFQSWLPKKVGSVPFCFIDPDNGKNKNVILLNGSKGDIPPKMPKSVKVTCNQPAQAIHILGAVAGWGFPAITDQKTVVIVRIRYIDGVQEDHALINGVHVSDYVKQIDVPGSQHAFTARYDRAVRYLAVRPRRTEVIEWIEFLKGDSAFAPVIMGVTLEK